MNILGNSENPTAWAVRSAAISNVPDGAVGTPRPTHGEVGLAVLSGPHTPSNVQSGALRQPCPTTLECRLCRRPGSKSARAPARGAERWSTARAFSLVLWLTLAGQISGFGADPLDQWVWRNPLPSGNSPFRVTFANGAFWGLNGATVSMSPDGTNWTSRGLPTVDDAGTVCDLSDIAYGNDRFLAVGGTRTPGVDGTRGVVLISQDGVTWGVQRRPTSVSGVGSVAYGNGLFVMVETGYDPIQDELLDVLQTSPDGVIWSSVRTEPWGTIWMVTHVNGMFFVIKDEIMLTSPDGVNWTEVVSGNSLPLRGVAYGNGTWVVVGGGTVLTSTDGSTWTNRIGKLPFGLKEVAYGNNTFVAVGSDGLALSSPDGLKWTQRKSGTTNSLYSIAFGNGTFVAANVQDMLISEDGINWRNLRSGDPADLYDIASGADGFVAVSPGGSILHSPDGAQWTRVTNALGAWAIVQGNRRFVAVTTQGNIVTSTDGVQWAYFNSGVTSPLYGITYGNGMFLAVGDKGAVLTSTNAFDWMARDSGSSSSLYTATFGNGMFVVSAGDGAVLTSTDGVEWEVGTSGGDMGFGGMAYGNGVFVGVGGATFRNATNAILVSTNGLDWSPLATGARAVWLYHVRYDHGMFVAVGDHRTLMTSTNGLDWVAHDSGTDNPLNGVAYGNGTFVTVGYGGAILQSGELPSSALRLGPIVGLANGAFAVTVSGPVGYQWEMQGSTDLTSWVPLQDILSTNATMQFVDHGATNFNRRFYRALSR